MTDGQGAGERRKDWRMAVRGAGALLLLSDSQDGRFPCDLLDVSLGGVRVASEAPLQIGQELILAIPDVGEYAAEVRWIRPPEAGLAIAGGPDLLLKDLAENPNIATIKPRISGLE